jgi:hypothetical protein
MKKVLFVLTSIAIFALATPGLGQYWLPRPGLWMGPGFWMGPGYWGPGYWMGPGYIAPGIYRGYGWREQRFYEARRNSYIVPETQNYEQQTIMNNAPRWGVITDPGECAIGFSEETCRRRGQKYNPPKPN